MNVPWFAIKPVVASVAGLLFEVHVPFLGIAPPLAVCDPAFVAEFPDAKGVLMNIGHFDEIAGVRHVEF